jgi:hypothetical protein
MMFARRAGISPTSAERRALHLSFLASYILLMLSFHTGASGDALVLSLGLPEKFTLPAQTILALLFVACSGWALVSLARRSSLRAIVSPFTLAVTQFLWFLLPALIEFASGREIRRRATAAAFSPCCILRNISGSPAITRREKLAPPGIPDGASRAIS